MVFYVDVCAVLIGGSYCSRKKRKTLRTLILIYKLYNYNNKKTEKQVKPKYDKYRAKIKNKRKTNCKMKRLKWKLAVFDVQKNLDDALKLWCFIEMLHLIDVNHNSLSFLFIIIC